MIGKGGTVDNIENHSYGEEFDMMTLVMNREKLEFYVELAGLDSN